MKETRKISELLQIMLDNVNIMKKYNTGMCYIVLHIINNGSISETEYWILEKYLDTSWRSKMFIFEYWWPKGLKLPRILWLKRHIFYNKLIGR